MFCSKCGRKTDTTGRYCQWCGVDLSSSPVRPLIRRIRPFIRTEEHAGIGRRSLAFFIDLVFILLVDLFITGLFGLSEGLRMLYQLLRGWPMVDRSGQEVTNALIPLPIVLSVCILFVLVPWFYYAFLERSKDQATLGKIAVRIAVTDANGNRITFARASLRHFAKLLTVATIFIGFLIVPFTRRHQALHDMVSGCVMFRQS
jgi:uncharacterized RDD family membrane protein YckC